MIRVRFLPCQILAQRTPLVPQGVRAEVPVVNKTLHLIVVPQGVRRQSDPRVIIAAQQMRIRRILVQDRPEYP